MYSQGFFVRGGTRTSSRNYDYERGVWSAVTHAERVTEAAGTNLWNIS